MLVRLNSPLWCKEWELPEPTYGEAGGSFVTIFHNTKQDKSVRTAPETRRVEGLVDGVVESQRKMLGLLKANPYISKKELSAKVGISVTSIDKNMNQLKKYMLGTH